MSPLGTFSPGVFWPAGRAFVRGGLSGGSFARGTFPRGSFARGHFWPRGLLAEGIFVREGFRPGVGFFPGGLLPGGTFVWGAYARTTQVQCVYAPSRLSVPSIVA